MSERGQELERRAATSVAEGDYDYAQDAGGGFENQTRDDTAIPFIDILQPNSPEVSDPSGAKAAGHFINRLTGESKKELTYVPAITEHCYTEWIPREPDGSGGGFVGRVALTDPMSVKARNEAPFKKYRLPNGHDLAETFYAFGLDVDPETEAYEPVGFPFGSTKIKAYKSWMHVARSILIASGTPPNVSRVNPPLFAHKYRFTTKLITRGNQRWFVPVIGFAGKDAESSRLRTSDPLYIAARGLRDAYMAGTAKADYSKTESSNSGGAEDNDAPF